MADLNAATIQNFRQLGHYLMVPIGVRLEVLNLNLKFNLAVRRERHLDSFPLVLEVAVGHMDERQEAES